MRRREALRCIALGAGVAPGTACGGPSPRQSAADCHSDGTPGGQWDLGRLENSWKLQAPAIRCSFNYASVSKEWAAIGQVYQADLAAIGVTLQLKPVEPVALVAQLRAHSYNGIVTGIVPLGGIAPTPQAVDPHYSPVVSFSGFRSPTLEQLATTCCMLSVRVRNSPRMRVGRTTFSTRRGQAWWRRVRRWP